MAPLSRDCRASENADPNAECVHEDGAERAGGLGVVEADAMALGQSVRVVPLAGDHEAFARRAVEGAAAGVAELREAEDGLAQVLGRVAEREGVALGRGRGGSDADRDGLVEGGVDLELVGVRWGGKAGDVGDVAVVDVGPAALGLVLGDGGAVAAVAEYDGGGQ